MAKAKTKTRSKQRKVNKGKLHRLVRWASSHKLLVALLVAVMFGGVGVWKLTTSQAYTNDLSYEKCVLRGRTFNWYSGECSGCQAGAGPWVAPSGAVEYGYCSAAVSKTIGTSHCASLKRDYVGIVGCARRWQQTNAANALQCVNNNHTYRVMSDYDRCIDPTAPAPTSGWVWPVPGTKSLGSLRWGEWGSKGQHKGIDIGISDGGSLGYKVVAAHSGRVAKLYNSGACGEIILIKAEGTIFWHAYQHLRVDAGYDDGSALLNDGTYVQAGQTIGYIGRAGGDGCGSNNFFHLHFSIEKGEWISFYASSIKNSINPCEKLPGC